MAPHCSYQIAMFFIEYEIAAEFKETKQLGFWWTLLLLTKKNPYVAMEWIYI